MKREKRGGGDRERERAMHLYHLCLPPPVAEEAKKEAAAFKSVVRSVKDTWREDDPDSIHDTLKWISVIDL